MPILVDTANVLHVTGVLPPELAGLDDVGLAELIRRSRHGRERVRLICDGGVPGERCLGSDGGMALRYTGSRSADEVIAAEIEASTARRRLLVVSDDRAVLDHARRRGCRTLGSETFLAQLAHDAMRPGASSPPAHERPRRPLDPVDVDAWLDHFGIDPQKESPDES